MVDFGGGYFDGSMRGEGSGARIKAGVKDVPIFGDVELVNVHVPGFRDGGVVGDDPRRDRDGKLRGRVTEAEPTPEPRRPRMTPSRMFRTKSLDNRPGMGAIPEASGVSPSRSRAAVDAGHTPNRGGAMAGMGRRKHEIAPGIPCPTRMTGETKPVR